MSAVKLELNVVVEAIVAEGEVIMDSTTPTSPMDRGSPVATHLNISLRLVLLPSHQTMSGYHRSLKALSLNRLITSPDNITGLIRDHNPYHILRNMADLPMGTMADLHI